MSGPVVTSNCLTHQARTETISNMAAQESPSIFNSWDDSANEQCPSILDTTLEGYIHERSTCPWHYMDDIDPRRIPSLIQQAVCDCSPQNGSLTTDGHNMNNHCEPFSIYMPVLFLRDGLESDDGCLTLADYDLGVATVNVSCVALPWRTSQQSYPHQAQVNLQSESSTDDS